MKASSVVSFALALLLLALVGIPLAQDKSALAAGDPVWWNDSWVYRKQLTFNNCGQSENLIDFPVLVKLTTSNFNYSHCRNDGGDIRFVDADNSTLLKYHFEKWTYNGDSWIWVKVPQIDGGSATDHVWLYYGNSGATGIEDEVNTYDANFMAVWHLKETTGGSGAIKDSTANGNDGTDSGSPGLGVTGKIGNAIDFDGVDDSVTIADSDSLDLANGLTIEAWIYIYTWVDWEDIVFKGGGAADNSDYQFALVSTGLMWDGTLAGAWRTKYFDTTTDTGEWIYVVVTHDTTTVKCYRAGSQIGSQSDAGNIYESTYQLGISQEGAVASGYIDGKIDEVRISDIARSADWIKAQYLSMTDAFIAFGLEQVPLPLISGWGWCLAYKEVGDVTLDLAGSMIPRANAPEVVDLHLVGTLNFSIPGRTDTFELELLGTRVRSLFFLKQVEGGADPLIAEFEGFWLAENDYIACEGRLAITTPNHAAQPYAFVLRTGGVDVPSREPGGWVEDIEFIIQKGALALDRVGDRLAQGGAVIKDLLGTVLTAAAVIVREVRKLGEAYIP